MLDGTLKLNTDYWPANLFNAFNRFLLRNNIKGKNFDASELSYDQIKGLEYTLDHMGKQEQNVLLLSYKQALTADEIMSQLNISYVRLLSLKTKAFTYMLNEPYFSYILNGFKTTQTKNYVEKRSAEPRYIHTIAEKTGMTETETKNFLNTDILTITVHKRTTNALRRYGIQTVYDLVWLLTTSPDTVKLIKSIGNDGIQNIINWLTEKTKLTYKNPFEKRKKAERKRTK